MSPLAGADLSHHNLLTDMAALAGAVTFLCAKATEGTGFADPTYAARAAQARAAGLAVGACHVFDPGLDGAAQARHVLAVAAPQCGDVPPALDLETAPLVATVRAATGRPPVLYASPAFWDAHLGAGFAPESPLWLADYAPAPRLPAGRDRWTFWQHSGSGTLPGVSGPVDLDLFQGDAAQLSQLRRPAPPT